MKVFIVSPAARDSTLGNNITATRWEGILRSLGCHVDVACEWNGESCDILVALHARKSYASIQRFHNAHGEKPLIVALTGTDLYNDLPANADAQQSLLLASRIVALQSTALNIQPEPIRMKATVIYQSARPPMGRLQRSGDEFLVCVLSHLREVKDPLRVAEAARLLPPQSKVRVVQAGRALDAEWDRMALSEVLQNSRFCWLGDQSHETALELLASSDLYVLSSLMEGGANGIAEAVVCGIPILCSHIPGNVGMLGPDYPGYFLPRDTANLSQLIFRAESDPHFLGQLRQSIRGLQSRFSPEQEEASWRSLLDGCDPVRL